MADLWESRTKLLIRALVSFFVLGVALYVMVSGKHVGEGEKWAAGAIGVVPGLLAPLKTDG